jgi:hypothetical protein
MYTRVANRLALTTEDITSWISCQIVVAGECIDPPGPIEVNVCPPAIVIRDSQPVSMEGLNAAQFDVVVINISATNPVEILLQGSNDLENWVDLGVTVSESAPGYYVSTLKTEVDTEHVRLRYRMWQEFDEQNPPATFDYAVVAAGIYTFEE